ncbi:DUF429 domain-containing protein [Haloarchaeobius sp. HME9146]|uniref:DUF429 domain-containing protein n=1 Tax=Haloarchaeobius sp. HME9146 TaxID=2978732 RepID=UPI0021C073F0|nr:DUF429 domain-containing protein [Haloarchaeobius sp. HME9146]MCT9095085.1 DUF429 domain-containing protein [Haloarchaeobius sp. HME9146]
MNSTPQFVGVDGSPDGWVAVRYSEAGFEDVQRYDAIQELWEENSAAETILVDIPIGLAKDAAAREPEKATREKLTGRTSSVFNVPIRGVLDIEDYDEANEEQKDEIDKGLQKQTFNITPRIREVDELLLDDNSDATQETLRESHPEVCFWAFHGEPMQYSKTGQPAAAFWERVEVLKEVDNSFTSNLATAGETIVGWGKPELSNDDLLDAFVLALTAKQGHENDYQTLPEKPTRDEKELNMEMVYAQPESGN